MKKWEIKRLPEIAEYFIGLTYSPKDVGDKGIIVLRSSNIQNDELDLSDLVRVARPVKEMLKVRDGDILMCSRNGSKRLVGKTTVISSLPEDMTFGTFMTVIRGKHNPYLAWFFKSDAFREQLGVGENTMINQITKYMLDTIRVPFPPPAEQHRIVGVLEEAFVGIATAKANTEKNLQNAPNLYESYLESVFYERGAKWERVTLEHLLARRWIESHLDGNHGSDYPRKQEFIDDGVPYISANCLDNERVDMSRAKYLSQARAALIHKGIAKDVDVLFAHNATVGPVAILRTDEEKVILGTSLTYYRCNSQHILPEYLAHYMRSSGFKTQYLQVMRQSTRNQVPITKQREFYHVVPPIEEQKYIIGALDGLFENSQQLASLYERKLAALEELKKSLLHQAFTGKL
jgi:type I restriction enzyme S subunit